MADAQKLIAAAKKNRLTSLDLANCGLTEIPEELFELTWLEELSFSQDYVRWNERKKVYEGAKTANEGKPNCLQNLPPALGKLAKLKMLAVMGDQENRWEIGDLSPLSGLTNLQLLYVSQTQVGDLSPLSDLTNLKILEISHTEVGDLSPLSGLTNLEVLFVYQTQVSDLTPLSGLTNLQMLIVFQTEISDLLPLSGLTNLQWLNIFETQVSDLSPLNGMTNLLVLNISQTQVSNLSPIVPLLEKNLKDLRVDGCPLRHPPLEIAEQGTPAILRYFQALEKESITLREAKVLLVGQGESGKTTLRRKLKDPAAAMPTGDEMTWGIEFESLDFPVAGGEPMTLHLWDFGGQNIQHYAHQFFLTGSSLYVLLTNERGQNDHFAYWLSIIEMLGGGSPVLVVQNEKAGHLEPIADWAGMKVRFRNLVAAHQVNLKEAQGNARFEALRQDILAQALKLGHVGKKYPGSFVRLRERLRQLAADGTGRQYLHWHEFEQHCREAGQDDPATMQDYATTLTFLGECLHLADSHDDVLCDYVFLHPRWIIEALYLLLRHERVLAQNGMFSAADARLVWSGEEHRGMHDKLIRLLLHFHLCYKMRDEPRYVVPQRLPSVGATEPSLADEFIVHSSGVHSSPLTVFYQYVFLPKGILTRLTCRLHLFIEEADGKQQVWNEAVLFRPERMRARAYVREVYASHKIRLTVAGQDRHELLNRLVDELDDIHAKARFENLQVKKLVPCPCKACAAAEEIRATFHDYEQLRKYLLGGKVRQVPCPLLDDVVDIREILRHSGIEPPLEKLKKEVKNLLAADRVKEALAHLRKHLPHDNRTWAMSGQRSRWVEGEIFGVIGLEESNLEENRLRQRILTFLEELPEGD